MQAEYLTRRLALLLPFALAACATTPARVYEPMRYNYLPPIQLNVTSIAIQQRFVPAGVLPDVSNQDPVPPVEALKTMASDRLQAFGTSNKAVFDILDASLTRQGDVISGSFAVSLTVLDDRGSQLGFAEARQQSHHTGRVDDLRAVLYDMTKTMMSDMNVEFEYQIRRNLKNWLTVAAAPDAPVEQTPLDQSAPNQPPLETQPNQSPLNPGSDQLPPQGLGQSPQSFDQSPPPQNLLPQNMMPPQSLGQPAPATN